MTYNDMISSNVFFKHHQLMQTYDNDIIHQNYNSPNTNHSAVHPSTSNWSTSQTVQMISPPITTCTTSTSMIHSLDNYNYSDSFPPQINPFSLLKTSPIHYNNVDCNTHHHPHRLHCGMKQSDSLFLPYQNYMNRWNSAYVRLIAKAILSTQERRMILSEIYQWIQLRYPYFSSRGPGWRNSIRHNLSLNDCFIKVGRAANGKGHYWGIHPANLKDFLSGDFRRRRAQRKVRRALGLSRPDDKLHKQDDDDDDDDEDDDEDRDGDVGVDDQDTLSSNPSSILPPLFHRLHPHISTYQSMRSTLTTNSSPTLNTHPLINSHISTLDRLTDSPTNHNHSTNNPTNITTPLLFNPSHFTSTHNSQFLPHHQALINASSTSRTDTSTTSTQSIQSLDLTTPPLKSNCTNDTLMELFYINLMHLLNNHHLYIQSHLQHDLSTPDKFLLSTTQSTTNTTTSTHTTHTSTTTNHIPISTTVTDRHHYPHHHFDDNVHYTNSSHPSLDPVSTRSHSPATSHPPINLDSNSEEQ
ncbi:unnamed protein product [Schistosoma turkestanicum]|nr:unnamed protein product [Schistosoma turkestanicum]